MKDCAIVLRMRMHTITACAFTAPHSIPRIEDPVVGIIYAPRNAVSRAFASLKNDLYASCGVYLFAQHSGSNGTTASVSDIRYRT